MTIERVVVPAEVETPEQNMVEPKVETPEKKWTEDITIPVPLNEFLNLKEKIMELEQNVKDAKAEEMKEFSRRMEAERTITQLKDQIKEMLGIEEKKGDDGK